MEPEAIEMFPSYDGQQQLTLKSGPACPVRTWIATEWLGPVPVAFTVMVNPLAGAVVDIGPIAIVDCASAPETRVMLDGFTETSSPLGVTEEVSASVPAKPLRLRSWSDIEVEDPAGMPTDVELAMIV